MVTSDSINIIDTHFQSLCDNSDIIIPIED